MPSLEVSLRLNAMLYQVEGEKTVAAGAAAAAAAAVALQQEKQIRRGFGHATGRGKTNRRNRRKSRSRSTLGEMHRQKMTAEAKAPRDSEGTAQPCHRKLRV